MFGVTLTPYIMTDCRNKQNIRVKPSNAHHTHQRCHTPAKFSMARRTHSGLTDDHIMNGNSKAINHIHSENKEQLHQ